MLSVKNLFIALMVIALSTVVQGQQLPEPTRIHSTLESGRKHKNNGQDTIRLENELTIKMEIPGMVLESCPARVSLSYYQKNTLAHVEGEINYPECAQSNGSFDVIASLRHDDGSRSTVRFTETWQSDGKTQMSFIRDYPIGENLYLSQVSTSRAQCTCTMEEMEQH